MLSWKLKIVSNATVEIQPFIDGKADIPPLPLENLNVQVNSVTDNNSNPCFYFSYPKCMGNCEVSLEGCVNHGYSWVSFKSNGRKEIVTLTTEGGEEEMNYTSEKFMLKQRRYRIKVNVNLTTITGWPVENENVAIFICPGHVSICGEGAPWIVKIETKT